MTDILIQNRWRKTKGGKWAIMGLIVHVVPGATVTVIAKSGRTKQVLIKKVGKSFTTDEGEMVYGYEAIEAPRGANESYWNRRSERDHEDCLSFGSCGPNCDYDDIVGRRR